MTLFQKATSQGCRIQATVVDGVARNSVFFGHDLCQEQVYLRFLICDMCQFRFHSVISQWENIKMLPIYKYAWHMITFIKWIIFTRIWSATWDYSWWRRFGMNRSHLSFFFANNFRSNWDNDNKNGFMCLIKTHRMILSATYPGKKLALNDLDSRSNYQLTIWDNQYTNRCILMRGVPTFPLLLLGKVMCRQKKYFGKIAFFDDL